MIRWIRRTQSAHLLARPTNQLKTTSRSPKVPQREGKERERGGGARLVNCFAKLLQIFAFFCHADFLCNLSFFFFGSFLSSLLLPISIWPKSSKVICQQLRVHRAERGVWGRGCSSKDAVCRTRRAHWTHSLR